MSISELETALSIATDGVTRNGVLLTLLDEYTDLVSDARQRLEVLKTEKELCDMIADAMSREEYEPVEECLVLYKRLYGLDDSNGKKNLLAQSIGTLDFKYRHVSLGVPTPELKLVVSKCEGLKKKICAAHEDWRRKTRQNLEKAYLGDDVWELESALSVASEGELFNGMVVSLAEETALLGKAQIRLQKLKGDFEDEVCLSPFEEHFDLLRALF